MPRDALPALVDSRGRGPTDWMHDPLRDLHRVVTLAPAAGTLHVDGRSVRASPTALPLDTDSADGVLVAPGLHLVTPLDLAFAELRRVLRPAGTLVVVVPSRAIRSLSELRHLRTLRPVRRGPWGHTSALYDVGWLLAAADFAVLGDDRVPFVLPLPDADAARRAVVDLPASGLWPAHTPAPDALAAALARQPGRNLPVPLRRLVARR